MLYRTGHVNLGRLKYVGCQMSLPSVRDVRPLSTDTPKNCVYKVALPRVGEPPPPTSQESLPRCLRMQCCRYSCLTNLGPRVYLHPLRVHTEVEDLRKQGINKRVNCLWFSWSWHCTPTSENAILCQEYEFPQHRVTRLHCFGVLHNFSSNSYDTGVPLFLGVPRLFLVVCFGRDLRGVDLDENLSFLRRRDTKESGPVGKGPRGRNGGRSLPDMWDVSTPHWNDFMFRLTL